MNHRSLKTGNTHAVTRSAVIKSAAAAAAYSLLPKFMPSETHAAEQSHTRSLSDISIAVQRAKWKNWRSFRFL